MRNLIALSLVLALASASTANEDTKFGPMENPDLFGGDMVGIDPYDRSANIYKALRWPNGVIPYVIDPSLAVHKLQIDLAMEQFRVNTCVLFRPRRTTDHNYIRIFAGQGCYSNVGMLGGQQPVSLGDGCINSGSIVHELNHVVGFYHEQNRSDRDEKVTVHWENIGPGQESAFAKLRPHENLLLSDFDYDSVMLYGSSAYSRDGIAKTMVKKNGDALPEIHHKDGLSDFDILKIIRLYECKYRKGE